MNDALERIFTDAWSWPALLLGGALCVGVGYSAYLAWQALSRLSQRVRAGRGRWRNALLRLSPFAALAIFCTALLVIAYLLLLSSPLLFALALLSLSLSLALASSGFLRNVLAGLVISVQRPYWVGDYVRVLDFEGELVRVGIRATLLRTTTGNAIEIPNSVLTRNPVVNLRNTRRAHPVSVELEFPHDTDTAWAKALGLRAASISRFAAPRCAPEVLLRSNGKDTMKLEVRSAAISPLHEAALRSEIIELVHDTLRERERNGAK